MLVSSLPFASSYFQTSLRSTRGNLNCGSLPSLAFFLRWVSWSETQTSLDYLLWGWSTRGCSGESYPGCFCRRLSTLELTFSRFLRPLVSGRHLGLSLRWFHFQLCLLAVRTSSFGQTSSCGHLGRCPQHVFRFLELDSQCSCPSTLISPSNTWLLSVLDRRWACMGSLYNYRSN